MNDPLIAEWDFTNPPASNCLQVDGGDSRCDKNTFCIDASGMGDGVCARGCNPLGESMTSTLTGCEATTVATTSCADALIGQNPGDGTGICQPAM